MKKIILLISLNFLSIFCFGMQGDEEAAQKMRSDIAKNRAAPIWKIGVELHSKEYDRHLEILKQCPITITKNGVYLLDYNGVRWSYYPPPKKISHIIQATTKQP